ncbi:MAG TPA: copper oxidase [Tepidisphaeraceae bacterium]|jgi:FtsP/CotA-like multicopper oxidase with cupredoxin domain
MSDTISRRTILANGAVAIATGAVLGDTRAALAQAGRPPADQPFTPVHTPNGVTVPFKLIGGVKVFHLVAREFEHEFAPGLVAKVWGYNGRSPGPTLELVEGDRVRVYVTNRLPEATTIHWHGIILPAGMDGVSGLNQPPIPPGETYKYEFTLKQHGTFMYHSHFDEMVQIGLGMMGMLVVHPKQIDPDRRVDRDFVLMLSEWRLDPDTTRPKTSEMTDFNLFTINGKAFPGTAPLVCRKGDRVRVRFGNLSAMDHHPIHIHGHHWTITGTDGGPIPRTAWVPETTILVPVGSTRDVEFVADNPGDWAIHCHMTHHTMNQMGHGTPNLIGMDAKGFDTSVKPLLPGYMTMGQRGMGEHGRHMAHMPLPANSIPMRGADGPQGYIDMGGMFTILKIRDVPAIGYDDPGWYDHPAGTVSAEASDEELRRDGIDPAAQ